MNAVIAIAVYAAVFALIYRGTVDRSWAVLGGGAVMMLYGVADGFYPLSAALGAIYFETLALIFGMSLVSSLLARSGFFTHMAARTVAASLGNGWWVLVVLTLTTYAISLFVNNLTTIVIVLPLTLTACRQMRLNPVPLTIAEIVASNLGGASTMIGDFPNMIIASAGKLAFMDFIGGMMAPCLVLLAAFLVFFNWARPALRIGGDGSRLDIGEAEAVLAAGVGNPRLASVGLWLLGLTLLGFLLSDALHLRPSWIALIAGSLALLLGEFREDELPAACGVSDILFFTGLFVMVGGLVAAGVGEALLGFVEAASGGHDLLRLLVLMWLSAFVTIFLNAGPTAALFVPVAAATHMALGDPTVWWALSLGVLAGSSADLTGATAGTVAATHLERFMRDHPEMSAVTWPRTGLSFKGYLRWGLPVMTMFLVLSSLYIIVVAG
ncbi:MAG: SLC13 family permease [Alphaproteobacteria bacterium]